MNKKRLTMLTAIYALTRSLDDMDAEFLISDSEGEIDNLFDYQYLERKGYIQLVPADFDCDKSYAVLTIYGVDYVEEQLEQVNKDDREELEHEALKLRWDRMDKVQALG